MGSSSTKSRIWPHLLKNSLMEKLSFCGVNIKSSEYINIFKSNISFWNQRIVHGVYVNYTYHELGFFEMSFFYNIFICFNWFLWPIMNLLFLYEFFFSLYIYLGSSCHCQLKFRNSMLLNLTSIDNFENTWLLLVFCDITCYFTLRQGVIHIRHMQNFPKNFFRISFFDIFWFKI